MRVLSVIILVVVFVAGVGWFFSQKNSSSIDVTDILGEIRMESSGWPTLGQPTPIPTLAFERIFSPNHSWVTSLPQAQTVTMIATGDVIPARSVNYKMTTGRGFRWPFEKTKDVLSSADLTVINLETPLMSACPVTNEGMIFCGNAKAVEGLTYAGIDVATLGNNHIGNHDLEGIEETKRVLMEAGILPVTIGPTYKDVKGMRFAFLSYNDIGTPEAGVPWADENVVKKDIAEARKSADIVIVSYHWGVEYVTQPNDRQRTLAHMTVDSGADVVLGNHPHWVQPIELYNGKFIIYAHGNFVFDQEWSEETKLGVVGRYTFYDKKLVDVEYLPIRIVDYGQPYFLEGDERDRLLGRMKVSSETLAQ